MNTEIKYSIGKFGEKTEEITGNRKKMITKG